MLKEMQIYGYNALIRQYTGYPSWLFLPCHSEHGIMMKGEILESDLQTDKPLMLIGARYSYDLWKERSELPAILSGSPFVHHRRKHQIEQSGDASGSVAFPAHTVPGIKAHFDIEKYCEQLRELPNEFQPVTICLHWQCVKIGRDEIYRRAGFDVTCAGHYRQRHFARNFYEILRRHRYSTSNLVGSYLFYSVEMNIPFFLTGDTPTFTSNGADINAPKGDYTTDFWPEIAIVKKAFNTGPTTTITREQRELVEEAVGINDCVSGPELKKALLEAFRTHYLKTQPWAVLSWMLKSLIRLPAVLLEESGLRSRHSWPGGSRAA